MKTGKVVIGANYGDEGKGLLTDYFASHAPDNSLVVRFNGGAQAGHTVVTPDGRRHVFSHFGSGTFVGAPTFLSKFFIVNPLIFVKEYSDLQRLGAAPQIIIDRNAMMTTPFDMLINQTAEIGRGAKRHGSCGLGINETVTRSLRASEFRVNASDAENPILLRRRLLHLKNYWLPTRIREQSLDLNCEQAKKLLNNLDLILDEYIKDTQSLLNLASITDCYPKAQTIIFEGAQGLMLDEDRIDQFPHVTRSKTGLTNVLHLAPFFGIEKLDVTYVTRTYLTRHGAGPLEHESEWSFPDLTNVPNQFQGTLRFAPLNLDALQTNIQIDLLRTRYRFGGTPSIPANNIAAGFAMTCVDQVPMPSTRKLFLPVNYISYGPTRTNVHPALTGAMR
jgi:adenylosuccinate synthase